MATEKIGLLGGTFNPVHTGHLQAAEEVERKLRLDKILFIPSYIPPHKRTADMASPEDRFHMVELAVLAYPRFIACDIEIEAKERSYSIITLNKIKDLYPEAWVFFILGVDAFLEIETWRSYEKVLEQCHFIVITRPGYSLAEARKVLPSNYRDKIYDWGEQDLDDEALIANFRVFIVPIRALDISSTEIRQRIREGKPIKGLVPETVEAFIREKSLYQE